MNKTHWSVWVTIVFTAISSILWVTTKIVKVEEQVRFLNDRLDKVIDMCCDEVNQTLIEGAWSHAPLGRGIDASEEKDLLVLRQALKDNMQKGFDP